MLFYDLAIFSYINGFADHWRAVNYIGIFLAEYLQYFLAVLLAAFFFYPIKDREKNRQMVLVAITSALISRFVVKNFLVLFISRPRPYMVVPSAHKLIATTFLDNFQSFPSGHALFFFSLATAVCFYNKKLGIFLFACATLMGLARVFCGVHYLSDVMGGAIIGIAVAFIVQRLYLKIKRNHEF